MILSQTFYRISNEQDRARYFLQKIVETHEIWKVQEFWEGIVKSKIQLVNIDSINDEMNSINSNSLINYETPEDKDIRVQNIVFGQMISFAHHMLFFSIPKEKVKELITNLSKLYHLNEDLTNHMIKNVDDYTNCIDHQVKHDIIDDCLPAITDKSEEDCHFIVK